MTNLPKWEISHIGIYVTDMDRMREFYTRLLGFKVMDAGELRPGVSLTFLSKDPRDHHQIVLVSGREKGTRSTINQITFRVASLREVRAMHDLAVANNVEGVDPVDHGNAWSVYFLDPEGNRLEFFCDTPWYVAQPRRQRLDFSLSDREIEKATRRSIADDPTTVPFEEWRERQREELGLHHLPSSRALSSAVCFHAAFAAARAIVRPSRPRVPAQAVDGDGARRRGAQKRG